MVMSMRKLIVSIALGVAVLFAMAKTPSLAIETDYASKLPEVVQTLKPGVQLVGYRHGGGTANTGNASAIIPAGTTRSAAAATNTTIVRPMAAAVAAITRRATTMAAVISASMVL